MFELCFVVFYMWLLPALSTVFYKLISTMLTIPVKMFVDYDLNITVTELVSTVRLINSPVGTTVYRNNRERWAIALKLGGKTYYNINNTNVLSDKNHPVLLPKSSTYSWKCVEAGECILIEFDALEKYPFILPFKIADNTFILNSFAKLENLLNNKNTNYKIECINKVYDILIFLLKSVSKKYVPKDKRRILEPAIEYISHNYYAENITNDFLANLCSISTAYFRKLFENVYGVSPIKYLNNFRVEKAKSMLISDFEYIGQIAESVGYNSIYHFSKMFKLYTGLSPTEYKNAHL